MIIKPFAFILIMALVVALECVIMRLLPEGRIKRLLAFRWSV